MEYRKLISFGKSSYVVSLPKSWVRQNKLEKGALIYIDENDESLILSAKEKTTTNETEINIAVDGKSIRRIQREIISAYIKDHKSIILTGGQLKEKAKEIQQTIQNLMALEVMEQTSQKMVAKDFLSMGSISIFNLVRKIDIILRAMIEDCEKIFEEDNYDNIAHRDEDVNRLCFLVFRMVEFGLSNPSMIYKKYKLRANNLLHLWWLTFNLESIGDEIKRIARYMGRVDLTKEKKVQFLILFNEAKKNYLGIMKAFHQKDIETAHQILETKDTIISSCESFYKENSKIENLGLITEKLKSFITITHNLGRVIYQHEFTGE